jgi:hypothetical protein
MGIIVMLIVMSSAVLAENKGMFFKKKSHYFGTFTRSGGTKTHSFEFENKGDKPVIISRVKSTCGCTAMKWSRKPVLPGQKGFVNVRFDPKKFSGYFSKKVSVYASGESQAVDLYVSGRIRVNNRISDEFKEFFGDLKADKLSFEMGEVEKGRKSVKSTVRLINIMRDTIELKQVNIPTYMSLMQTHTKIAPGGNCKLNLFVKPEYVNRWGCIDTVVQFTIKRGPKKVLKSIPVHCSIIDNFSAMDEKEKGIAPKAEFLTESELVLLPVKGGKMRSGKVLVKNSGQTPLEIRNVQFTGKGMQVKKYDSSIAPGKTGRITFTYGSANGKQKAGEKMVVWTNSPGSYKIEKEIKRE